MASKNMMKSEMAIHSLRDGGSIIPKLLEDPSFGYISDDERKFICAFDDAMFKLGYSAGNTIGDGICWGRHMLIYRKMGVKSASVVARIYMRDGGICLRLFLNNVSKHVHISPQPRISSDRSLRETTANASTVRGTTASFARTTK